MSSRRSFRASTEKGSTMLELMVSLLLISITMGAVVETLFSQRRLFESDLVRTRINQTMRGALDVVGLTVRQAGENLPATYPAIEIMNGSGSDPDSVILRRHVLDEIMSVCATLTMGSSGSSITVGLPNSASPPEPECIQENLTQNFNAWNTFRTANGGVLTAYVFDQSTKVGQYIRISNQISNAAGMTFTLQNTVTWLTTYNPSSADIYIIEEVEFALGEDNYLEMIERGLWTNGTPIQNRLASGVTGFSLQALLANGTTVNEVDIADDWTDIRAVQVEITGIDEEGHTELDRTVSARFFPRNILSK